MGDIHYHNHRNPRDECQMIMEDQYVQLLNYRRQLYEIDRVHNMKMDYLNNEKEKRFNNNSNIWLKKKVLGIGMPLNLISIRYFPDWFGRKTTLKWNRPSDIACEGIRPSWTIISNCPIPARLASILNWTNCPTILASILEIWIWLISNIFTRNGQPGTIWLPKKISINVSPISYGI